MHLKNTIRFALLGDVEPKPEPIFTNFEKAINAINAIHAQTPLNFAASIGDIPHNGKLEQYENATQIIRKLQIPLFNIMGNEEFGGGVERFQEYAAKWRGVAAQNIELRFVKEVDPYIFIFLTASEGGVRFSDDDLAWLQKQLQNYAERKVLLFTHAPVEGVFESSEKRTIPNENFKIIIQNSAVRLHFSGHVHLDPDFVPTHVEQGGIHYIHVPGIERTKIGDGKFADIPKEKRVAENIDGNTHTPRIKVLSLDNDGTVDVQTYNLDEQTFEDQHRARFVI